MFLPCCDQRETYGKSRRLQYDVAITIAPCNNITAYSGRFVGNFSLPTVVRIVAIKMPILSATKHMISG